MQETSDPQVASGLLLASALLLAIADTVLSLPAGHGTVADEISAIPAAQLAFVASGVSEQPDIVVPALLGP